MWSVKWIPKPGSAKIAWRSLVLRGLGLDRSSKERLIGSLSVVVIG